jgi:hypothetical protein
MVKGKQKPSKRSSISNEQILASVEDDELAFHCLLRDDAVSFSRHACKFEPHSKQIEVLTSPLEQHKTMLPWGRRFGKTQIVAIYLAWRLFSTAGYNAFIFAPSGDQSRVLFEYVQSIYETSAYLKRYAEFSVKGNRLTVGGKEWGSSCEHVKTGLVGDHARGKGVKDGKGLIVFDEINSFLYPEQITSTIKPYISTGGGMVLLSSPGEIGSWMYQTYLDWKEQQRLGSDLHRVIECQWSDTDHIKPDVVAEEKRECEAKNRLWWFEREYLGKWTTTEGAFFDRQDVESCYVGDLASGARGVWIMSLDPGIDRSPSVLLVARFNQILDRLEIVDCRSLVRFSNQHVRADDGHEKIAEYEEIVDLILELRRSRPIHTFYIDPATEKNIGERLKNSFQVNVKDVRIGGYSAKLAALKDLQRSLADQKIVWSDHRITRQLLEFSPPINRQTSRYEFPDRDYDIISALVMLNRYIGDRTITPFFVDVGSRSKAGALW